MTGMPGRAGLSRTVVILPQWSGYHVPTAEGQLTAACVIRRTPSGALAGFNEATGTAVLPAATVIYKGPCRVQRQELQEQQQPGVGEREVTILDYRVVLPADAPTIRVDDIVQITSAPDDAQLVGVLLRVRGIVFGSLRWQRDLSCELVEVTNR